jgi:uncharacterized protein YbaP (TraB family)
LLWRISGKQMAKPSYLFGTMHLICRSDYIWTAAMTTSLDKSEKVCFEMDLDDTNVMVEATSGLIDSTGKKLSDYFTPTQYELLKQYVKDSVGIDISYMEHMKPVALQTLLSAQNSICSDAVSYEDSIMKIAQAAHKEILGLEEAREQLTALESIPTDTVIKELIDIAEHKDDNSETEYKQMVTAYKAQDLAALYKIMIDSKELQEEMGIFLDDRNKRWIPRMTDKMRDSSVFFAVGAGHLWGNNGVISLLRYAGYQVEAVH